MANLKIGAALLLSLLATSCGGGTMSTTTVTPPPPTGIAITVSNTSQGAFSEAMSTSFQPAEWDYQFFMNFPAATTPLGNLLPEHIRLQPVSQGVPQKADQTWDFTTLNDVLNPVINVADKSPELQLATAPAWMDDSNGSLLPTHLTDFATYSADMVSYYNTSTGFFDTHGIQHVHSPSTPITYWGIFQRTEFQ